MIKQKLGKVLSPIEKIRKIGAKQVKAGEKDKVAIYAFGHAGREAQEKANKGRH